MEKMNLLTVEEAAAFLTLKVSKVRDLIFTGKIPYYKLGHLVRLGKEDLSTWIEEQKRTARTKYELRSNSQRLNANSYCRRSI